MLILVRIRNLYDKMVYVERFLTWDKRKVDISIWISASFWKSANLRMNSLSLSSSGLHPIVFITVPKPLTLYRLLMHYFLHTYIKGCPLSVWKPLQQKFSGYRNKIFRSPSLSAPTISSVISQHPLWFWYHSDHVAGEFEVHHVSSQKEFSERQSHR